MPVLLYAVTMFLTAALLFVLEPLVAKALLPVLGGGAAVWITALAFFQVALLAGYLYAHVGPKGLGMRRHAILHVVLLVIVAAAVPLAPPAGWVASTAYPSLWLCGRLAISVGPSFVLLAATAPLIQRWLAATDHSRASDPYFLYVASNAGSLLALLAYPILIEPMSGLLAQRRAWNASFLAAIGLLAACAGWTFRHARQEAAPRGQGAPALALVPISARTRARWLALSAVPSSLLLSITTHVTTDLAALPLLWVIPLVLYLLTFIVAFGRRAPAAATVARLQPFVLLPVAIEMFLGTTGVVWALLPLHGVAFFVTALVCHRLLAESRPPGEQATTFYLWVAAGGAIGGLCNVFVAPLLFTGVLEYPVGLVLAALLRPRGAAPAPADARRARTLDVVVPLALALGLALGGLAREGLAARAGDAIALVMLGLLLAAAGVVGYASRERPLRFGLALAAIFAAGWVRDATHRGLLYATRSFYAIHRVTSTPPATRALIHGNTVHGMQDGSPERRREPVGYYHRAGPIGGVMTAYAGAHTRRVAVAGLGVGTLAAYASPGEHWTFFEIDPTVLDIARDRNLFSYLADSPAKMDYVLGDARVTIASTPEAAFGMVILDAFNSDGVPAHLLTREALALYTRKLAPGGLLAFHVSNRFLDLEPVVGGAASALGLAARSRCDFITSAEAETGKSSSCWLVVARADADLARLAGDARWKPARVSAAWTDDAWSLWRVFRPRG
jgi:SAM-dependent methyltransferase